MRAIWKHTIIAESDHTVIVDRNHYFPEDVVKQEYLRKSTTRTRCPWKGEASYYDVVVGDDENKDAAWCYPDPAPEASQIKDHLAFWRDIEVVD